MRAEGSLGSRPSPFRAGLNYVHAANICIIKTHAEWGMPGTKARLKA